MISLLVTPITSQGAKYQYILLYFFGGGGMICVIESYSCQPIGIVSFIVALTGYGAVCQLQ